MPVQQKLTVIADTREKVLFDFDADRFEVVRATLRTGDYTLPGLEDRVTLERKSISDLVSSVIHDAIRFRKELYRLAAFDLALIVVECDYQDVLQHRYESEASPASVIGRVHGYLLDHGVQTVFVGHRPNSTDYVERLLTMAHKKLGGRS